MASIATVPSELSSHSEEAAPQPYIVYLDQNKWIELARALKTPDAFPEQRALLRAMATPLESGRLIIPLTAANIYETHKINDPERRHDLARLQATVSQGRVFRGRYRRLEAELRDFLDSAFDRPRFQRVPLWFLSDIFFEAYADWDDARLGGFITEMHIREIHRNAAYWLYDFLVAMPADVRITAVRNFSDGSDQLRERIEERRQRYASETLAMRRKLQSINLVHAEQDLLITLANRAGYAWKTIGEMGRSLVRRLPEEVPIYYIEREIALRLEAQSRPIEENDFRDMQSFCAIIPYADEVIGENQFVNLARQSHLDKKFKTKLGTDILALREILASLG